VGQALASRTHGDLAAVTADIPAVVVGGQPPRTSVHGRTRKPINKVKVIAWGACVICALAVVGIAAAVLISSRYLLLLSGLAFIGASAVAWGAMVEAWVQKRSHGRLTQGPAPGAGSRASQRTRPAAEAEQLPQINHGQQEQAEAVQTVFPGANAGPARGHRVNGALAVCRRRAGRSPCNYRAISQGHERSITATGGLPSRLLSSFIGRDLSTSQANSAGFESRHPLQG
jgi:hypothetical protein